MTPTICLYIYLAGVLLGLVFFTWAVTDASFRGIPFPIKERRTCLVMVLLWPVSLPFLVLIYIGVVLSLIWGTIIGDE